MQTLYPTHDTSPALRCIVAVQYTCRTPVRETQLWSTRRWMLRVRHPSKGLASHLASAPGQCFLHWTEVRQKAGIGRSGELVPPNPFVNHRALVDHLTKQGLSVRRTSHAQQTDRQTRLRLLSKADLFGQYCSGSTGGKAVPGSQLGGNSSDRVR